MCGKNKKSTEPDEELPAFDEAAENEKIYAEYREKFKYYPTPAQRLHPPGCAMELAILEKHGPNCRHNKLPRDDRIDEEDNNGSFFVIGRMGYDYCSRPCKAYSTWDDDDVYGFPGSQILSSVSRTGDGRSNISFRGRSTTDYESNNGFGSRMSQNCKFRSKTVYEVEEQEENPDQVRLHTPSGHVVVVSTPEETTICIEPNDEDDESEVPKKTGSNMKTASILSKHSGPKKNSRLSILENSKRQKLHKHVPMYQESGMSSQSTLSRIPERDESFTHGGLLVRNKSYINAAAARKGEPSHVRHTVTKSPNGVVTKRTSVEFDTEDHMVVFEVEDNITTDDSETNVQDKEEDDVNRIASDLTAMASRRNTRSNMTVNSGITAPPNTRPASNTTSAADNNATLQEEDEYD